MAFEVSRMCLIMVPPLPMTTPTLELWRRSLASTVRSPSALMVYCTMGDMAKGMGAAACWRTGMVPTSGAGVSAPDATAAERAETAVSAAEAETPSPAGTEVGALNSPGRRVGQRWAHRASHLCHPPDRRGSSIALRLPPR